VNQHSNIQWDHKVVRGTDYFCEMDAVFFKVSGYHVVKQYYLFLSSGWYDAFDKGFNFLGNIS